MRSRKTFFWYICIVLATVLAACLGFFLVPAWNYFTGRTTPWKEDYFSVSATPVSISDEAVQDLLNGSVTLDELYSQINFSSSFDFSLEAVSSSVAVSTSLDTPQASPSVTESSSSSNPSPAPEPSAQSANEASSASEKSSDSISSDLSASSAAETDASYEQEIKALIQQLYGVKARAESGLNQCIQAAYSEYHALPVDQQTQAKKIAICFSKAGQLSSLQASCDKEVNQIISEMRRILRENGQSTSLADSAEATYKNEKSAMYSTLISRLYS